MAMEARYADKHVSKRMDDMDVIVIQYIYTGCGRALWLMRGGVQDE
jgi:hypothetical protein